MRIFKKSPKKVIQNSGDWWLKICKCRFEYGYYITKKKLTQRVSFFVLLI